MAIFLEPISREIPVVVDVLTGMTNEQKAFVSYTKTAKADSVVGNNIAYFTNTVFYQNPPDGFEINPESFDVYVNKTYLSTLERTITNEPGSDRIKLEINTSELGYGIDGNDEIIIVGKLEILGS